MSLHDAIEAMEEEGIDGLMERLEFVYDFARVEGYSEGYEQGKDDAFEFIDRGI
jgi:hypothetical protein